VEPCWRQKGDPGQARLSGAKKQIGYQNALRQCHGQQCRKRHSHQNSSTCQSGSMFR